MAINVKTLGLSVNIKNETKMNSTVSEQWALDNTYSNHINTEMTSDTQYMWVAEQ